MSEPLEPTFDNFDAIVAANRAKVEAEGGDDDDVELDEPTETPELDDEQPPEETDETPDEDDEQPEEDDEQQQPDEPNEPDATVRAPLKALRASLKTGVATPELMAALGDLELEVDTVNGREKLTLGELPKHLMRERRFGREMAKTKEDQRRAQAIVDIEKARTQTWRTNPAELEQGLMVMGCEQALERVFWKWAHERHAYMTASPEERQRIDWTKQVERQRATERMELMEARRQLEEARAGAPQQMDEVTQQTAAYIDQNMDRALGKAFKSQKVGAKVSDHARQIFLQELRLLGESGVPLEEAFETAAGSAAEYFADIRQRATSEMRAAEERKPRAGVPPKRPPAGRAPERDTNGQFRPRTARNKAHATAEEFGRRFGLE